MKRSRFLAGCAAWLALGLAMPAAAQNLQDRAEGPAPPSQTPMPTDPQQVQFTADTLGYDNEADVVTADGDVRMYREGNRLRADKVVWNRKTGKVIATGSVSVTSPQGDTSYGDRIELTDSLKGGVVDNMLIVLNEGGRMAAKRGRRDDNGLMVLNDAAYTPCDVLKSNGCPKQPSWQITAVRVIYDPAKKRVYYRGARIDVFGFIDVPLPPFSHAVGDTSQSGFLAPDLRVGRVNGLEASVPYFFNLAPNKGLIVTPRVFTNAAPMLGVQYSELTSRGAFQVTAFGTYSNRSDDITVDPSVPAPNKNQFRGYIEGVGRFQLDENWSLSGTLRVATDKTFLRRYQISNDDRLRSVVKLERIDSDSYLSIAGWAVQTMRLTDSQAQQPFALPEIDYRRRLDDGLLGGKFEFELNTLGIERSQGQDTQRAFGSARWDLRKLTPWGQMVTFTGYLRGDVYHANNIAANPDIEYRGADGVHGRGIAAAAVDVQWPFIGALWGGTQRFTPRFQVVASPKTANLSIPNEDARAVDLEDSNLFALNRFNGYDRWESSTRFTYGAQWDYDGRAFSVDALVGQSYRLANEENIFPIGTGLNDRLSDIVGRAVVRYKDFVSVTYRFRLDKSDFAIRRSEIDATIGSRSTYIILGYLRLNRNIIDSAEDLENHEEARVGGRVQITRFWSAFGSAVVDLTNKTEDPLSTSDGFSPVRHRLGVQYEDDCLRIGLTWRRDYADTGDAKAGNSFLLSLAFKNLGR